jgi:hypothetical protein
LFRPFGNRVLIGLSSAFVAVAGLQGALKPRLAHKRAIDCDPDFGPEPWQGAAAALASVAAELKPTRCDVTVVLSNHFVRYALVPRSERLSAGDEELAFARYCFAKVHGERVKAWDVRLSGPDGRSARVASAIDAALLQAIQACFASGGRARVVSVQPYLMAAFNRCRPLARKDSAWLLLLESQRACLACIENGQWAAVRNIKGTFDGPEQWAELLDRERYLAGGPQPGADVMVHAAADGPFDPSTLRPFDKLRAQGSGLRAQDRRTTRPR